MLVLFLALASADSGEIWDEGYDSDTSMAIWQIVVVIIGFSGMVLFLAYTNIRLFYEECLRLKQYRGELAASKREASTMGIDVQELFKKKKDDDGKP